MVALGKVTDPVDLNNMCVSPSIPTNTCENGVDGYYYDFSNPQAEPTSKCEWRNFATIISGKAGLVQQFHRIQMDTCM